VEKLPRFADAFWGVKSNFQGRIRMDVRKELAELARRSFRVTYTSV
jgi:hypothetical protein